MDETSTNPEEEQATGEPETPEDVAVLYTWANVHGGKYRDFSASRREFRAQQRHRMVEAQREAELDAARAKEEAATAELAEARRLEGEAAESGTDATAKAEAEVALRRAEENAERDRQEAQRHVETAEDLKRAMEQAQREVDEARLRAEEQATRWREADARWRAMNTGQQAVPGLTEDPYYYAGPLEATAFAPGKGVRSSVPQRVSSERRISESYQRAREGRRATDVQPGSTGFLPDRRHPDSLNIPPASGDRRRPQQFVEPRIETPEDTRERLRQDELSRRGDAAVGEEARFDDNVDDSYYDRDPGRGAQPAGSRTEAALGTAPSDLHIPPRALRTRATDYPSMHTGEPASPAHGNAQAFEPSRNRRRDSSVDITARVTRHPRDAEQQAAEVWGQRGSDDRRANPNEEQRRTGEATGRLGRPEWLASNAEPQVTERAGESTDAAPAERRQGVRSTDGRPTETASATGEPAERRRFPRGSRGDSDLRHEQGAEGHAAPEAPLRAARESDSEPQQPLAIPSIRSSTAADTLQLSRERVAARWFALKGLVAEGNEGAEPQVRSERADLPVPMIAVVSLAGGVGKTSLTATIGRALSASGEKVLLAETTSYGLLPYYFGARALRPDVVRTFSPPPGSTDAPIYMVNYETEVLIADDAGQARVVEQVFRHARGTQRVLLDVNGSSAWLARLLARQGARILVPVSPDMTSVIGIQAVERSLAGLTDAEGKPVAPNYVMNQFDASLPLHLDVREVLRKQLGDRLLTMVIRRSPAVSEALAEGMTVMDYAPDSPITEDYRHLAEWVRNLAAPATVGLRSIRWSER